MGLMVLGGCSRMPQISMPQFGFTRAAPAGSSAAQQLVAARRAATADTNSGAAQVRLAETAEAAGQFNEAAEALSKAITLDGGTADTQTRLGSLRLRAGNRSGAADAYSAALQQSPGHAPALGGIALLQSLLGDRAMAVESWRRAAGAAPEDWTLRSNYALSLLIAGRAEEAERVLNSAERELSAPQRARHNFALILAARSQHARVVRLLRAEMGPAEAEVMAIEFRDFADWLVTASPGEAAETLFRAPPATAAVAEPARR